MKHVFAFIYSLFLTLHDMLFGYMARFGMILMASSTAISAQGSTLQIGTGSGGAKTITAIAVGNPTVVTATAHGFSNGDVVAVAGVTGADAALINGFSWVVKYKTANTFAVELDSTGSGGAKTITAIAVGNPTVVTATAHGFSNGDVVAVAGVTGADAALINGFSWVVKYKTANTFAVELDSTGWATDEA